MCEVLRAQDDIVLPVNARPGQSDSPNRFILLLSTKVCKCPRGNHVLHRSIFQYRSKAYALTQPQDMQVTVDNVVYNVSTGADTSAILFNIHLQPHIRRRPLASLYSLAIPTTKPLPPVNPPLPRLIRPEHATT